MKSRYLTSILFLFSILLSYSQNSGSTLCDGSQPICSSDEFTFPNSFNGSPSETGPNYGCLQTQPNPAWFFLQIGETGNLIMTIEQSTTSGGSPDLDVDFILYGPFTDIDLACQGQLTSTNTVDCSYSANSVEIVNIPNAIAGEFYILLITNFSGQQGFISVTQTSGTGTTDCSILSTINGCLGSSITLDASTEDAVTYIWYEEDLASPGNYNPIAGIDTAIYDVFIEKKYKAEALASDGSIIETYIFNTNFFETPVAPTAINDYVICDNNGGNDGFAEFDLTTKTNEVLNGQDSTVFAVSYHFSEPEAQSGANALSTNYINTANPQEIFARIFNSQTPADLECYDIVGFNLIVNQVPNVEGVAISDFNMNVCELDGDDIETFDLDPIIQELEVWLTNNGQDSSDFNITLHTSQLEADSGSNAIVNPSSHENVSNLGMAENPQTIFVRIADATPINSLTCVNTDINFQLEVFDAAIATAPSQTYSICDNTLENGIDTGFGLFNLSATLNGDDYDYTGTTGLTLHEEILSGLPAHLDADDFVISFYSSPVGAEQGIGHPDQINEAFENTNPFSQTIFIRVEDSSLQGVCYDTTEMTLEVLSLPIFDLLDEYILCRNINGTELLEFPVIDTQLDENQFHFEWYLNNELLPAFNGMSSITATQAGEYTVTATNLSTGCNNLIANPNTYTTIVFESSPPILSAEIVNQVFTQGNSILVTAEGLGVSHYEFSFNNGPWFLGESSSNIFTHTFTDADTILLGENVIRVRDINGCGWNEISIIVMDYPDFFTPNGDGYNDTWNIYGMENQLNAKIYIYDRFGKLLKMISPLGNGWDGTFNGNVLPSSDYWFTVEYNEPDNLQGSLKKYNSHFTLKR